METLIREGKKYLLPVVVVVVWVRNCFCEYSGSI